MDYRIPNEMFSGTLRGRPHVLLVWINLLAHTDRLGCADISPRMISDETGLPEVEVVIALTELELPEKNSRCGTNEGRRIARIDGHRSWGWKILDNDSPKEIGSAKKRREYMRNYMAKSRAAKKREVTH